MASKINKKNVIKEIKDLIKIQFKDEEKIPSKTIKKTYS
jgi:hypothetical protein